MYLVLVILVVKTMLHCFGFCCCQRDLKYEPKMGTWELAMTILERTQETPGPHLLSCCCSLQAFSASISFFSRSKKSINIKTHKAERFVNINGFLTGWWWLAGELQDGGVGMRTVNSNNTTDHSKRPLSQITSDFWSPAGNFRKQGP